MWRQASERADKFSLDPIVRHFIMRLPLCRRSLQSQRAQAAVRDSLGSGGERPSELFSVSEFHAARAL